MLLLLLLRLLLLVPLVPLMPPPLVLVLVLPPLLPLLLTPGTSGAQPLLRDHAARDGLRLLPLQHLV